MRLSCNWLREFVELTVSPEELADKLTMAGLEVEAVERIVPDFSGVVVARVTKVEAHPQADRLVLTEVTDGRRTYRVVCGAPNVAAGRMNWASPRIIGGSWKSPRICPWARIWARPWGWRTWCWRWRSPPIARIV